MFKIFRVNELRETDATTLEKYIRKCLRKILTDEVARRFSWRGNLKNIPVSTYTVLKILKQGKPPTRLIPRKIRLLKREEHESRYYPSTSSGLAGPSIMMSDPHLNLPATTAVEFQNLERDINEDFTKECIFINELRETDSPTLGKYVRKCLRKMITDEAARKFSWRGNRKNFPVNTYTVLKILKHEAITKFPLAVGSDEDVEPIIRKWFQYAKDRYNKKNKKYYD